MLFMYDDPLAQISDIKSFHTKARFFKVQVSRMSLK